MGRETLDANSKAKDHPPAADTSESQSKNLKVGYAR
jgi:hypothetical protein